MSDLDNLEKEIEELETKEKRLIQELENFRNGSIGLGPRGDFDSSAQNDVSYALAEETSISRTPLKPRQLELPEIPPDVPEDVYVLMTQKAVELRMFDDEIADIMSTDILRSPSKRLHLLNKTSKSKLSGNVASENVLRMFGISAFPLVDPSDLIDNETPVKAAENVIGLRLEVFNERQRVFEKPHYIILRRNPKNQAWSIFKHTVPVFINIHGMFTKMGNGGPITEQEDIYIFTRDVYTSLTETCRRRCLLEDLVEASVISSLTMDAACTIVTFSIACGLHLKLQLRNLEVYACSLNGTRQQESLITGPLAELRHKLATFH
ncbi:LAMI_0C09054g1_1 [Lachancea mirantina]|uniref:LAMI_0C09054g1_1 n=1 Tax=Lachancea mirantina TaxID=1230905 RepID=A0A1G4J550_9SACH|nr:LAMI_0C09054g1_1 [Lachancea mirantina]